MALTVVKGTVALPASTGALTEIPATLPKLVMCWGTYQTAAGAITNVSMRWGIGFATFRGGAAQHAYVACWQTDELSFATYGESNGTDACYCTMASQTTIDCKVTATMDTDGVTFTVADAPATANILMHYLILGGSDITDAETHSFALSTAAATQDVTLSSGMGNPGDGTGWLSLFATAFRTTTGTGIGDIGIGFGAAKSSTVRAFSLWGGDDTGGTMNAAAWQKARALLGFTAAAGTSDFEADLDTSGHPTDGYRLAFPDQATISKRVISVAIRGDFGSAIGQQATRTSTGTQDIAAGFSETIRGAVLFGHSEIGATTPVGNTATSVMVNIGATDLTTEGAAGMGDDDGLGFTNPSQTLSTTQSLWGHGQPNVEDAALTLLYAGDASVSGTNLRLTYTTANATAREFAYLILGDAPAAAAPTSLLAPPFRQVSSLYRR